jgi:predicted ArsR family transcriptional regulator
MKQPAPVKLTEEETLRDARVLEKLQKAVGGYSLASVANVSRCSEVQARASLNRLLAKGDVEQYESFGHVQLWRPKREAPPEKLFS